MTTTSKKIQVLDKKILRVPRDERNKYTGGDYFEQCVHLRLEVAGDAVEFDLYESSAECDYCELTGAYTPTATVWVYKDEEEVFHMDIDRFILSHYLNEYPTGDWNIDWELFKKIVASQPRRKRK